MRGGLGGLMAGRGFALYMASQLFSSIGDAFEAVAAAMLLVDLTGSGLYAGIGLVFPPLCGILASSLAGSLGDRHSEKALLAIFGLLKGAIVLSLIAANGLVPCYTLLFLLSLANVFYGIPVRKLTASLLPGPRLLAGNSILNGLSGIVFFIGPALAGIFIRLGGPGAALLVAGGCYAASTLFLPFLPSRAPDGNQAPHGNEAARGGIAEGMKYCMRTKVIRNAILIYSVISFGSAATGLAFYPYAFDTLKAGPYEWGIIVSVFNGATLLSTAFPMIAGKTLGKSYVVPMLLCCMFVADAWFSYSLCRSFYALLPLLVVEGAPYFLCVMLLTTRLQLSSEPKRMARVLGTSDMASNAARLLGMGASAAMMALISVPAVFIACGVMLSLFALLGLVRAGIIKA